MRTTLNFDEDVLDKARSVASKSGQSIKNIINKALRLGLSQIEKGSKQRPYKTTPHCMKLKEGHSLDHIQDLLSQLDGEDSR